MLKQGEGVLTNNLVQHDKLTSKLNTMIKKESLLSLIVRLVIAGVAVLLSAYILSGVSVSGFWIAILVAFLLGFVNTYLKPFLVLISLPITILTLGLFLLVLNVLMVYLVDWIVPGFTVGNFWWALLFSIIQSLLNSFFQNAL